MNYTIARNYELTNKTLAKDFTAKGWASAVKKVAATLDPSVKLFASKRKLSVLDIAADMLVEQGKD